MSRLDEIKKRLEAATPGPWELDRDCDIISLGAENPIDIQPHAGKHPIVAALPYFIGADNADYRLISNAPSDIAWLLAEVETRDRRLAEVLEKLEIAVAGLDRIADWDTTWAGPSRPSLHFAREALAKIREEVKQGEMK